MTRQDYLCIASVLLCMLVAIWQERNFRKRLAREKIKADRRVAAVCNAFEERRVQANRDTMRLKPWERPPQ